VGQVPDLPSAEGAFTVSEVPTSSTSFFAGLIVPQRHKPFGAFGSLGTCSRYSAYADVLTASFNFSSRLRVFSSRAFLSVPFSQVVL
jgi:hypothetical protein